MSEHEFHEYTYAANEDKIVYEDFSFRIIKACFEVHNALGPGYPEKVYEEATPLELRKNNVGYERQKLIDI